MRSISACDKDVRNGRSAQRFCFIKRFSEAGHNIVVAAVGAADAPVVVVPEEHAALPAAEQSDVSPAAPVGPDTGDQLMPNNDGVFARTFGRPIGDQSWRYGRRGA
jgi:hypothetical protein